MDLLETDYIDLSDQMAEMLLNAGPEITFEWLGVGSVFMSVVIDGKFYLVHRFDHSNVLSLVYMSTPN